MTFESWKEDVPDDIREDPLWGMRVYQLSLFASDVSWRDAGTLRDEERTQSLADQLYRAVGSVGANVAEGYSRGSGKDRARFYEYALGSARESRDWYFKGRFVLRNEVVQHRLSFMTEIIRLLLTIIPQQRGGEIREPSSQYETADVDTDQLLKDVPLPS
ncbi:four helix bundle protein [Salinibacter ruber]|uniref:four helix bundle protein n=1 Tax=Salinibacter ruber TaxID=146919 RepID=UPI00216A067E|nr:four helix bundle protein [Salinibacter ruber]MCS3757153.1 four helix bundle protein [Salinibacter ruber]MCS3862348.1 four helix bundle protein [Salinibacter ruber]MCS3955698.1 four helix bundle protein [Salinibacter ruber]